MQKFTLIKSISLISVLLTFYSFNNLKPAVKETFTSDSYPRSGIMLGGIGTGGVEIRKDGNFYNWSVFNNYPYGTGPVFELPVTPNRNLDESYLFFLVRYQEEGKKAQIKLLQLNKSIQEGGMEGIIYYFPWMKGVEKIETTTRFPFTTLTFTDSEMPFDIKMNAFSPFIPHDVKNSALPGAYFKFSIKSKSTKKVSVMLLGSLRNLVGYETLQKSFESKLLNGNHSKFFVHKVSGMDTTKSSYGEMGLGVKSMDSISYYLGWEHRHPYYERLLFNSQLANIDDTPNRNVVTNGKSYGQFASAFDNDQRCFSSIASTKTLNAGQTMEATFYMNWYFPNNYGAIYKESKKDIQERTGDRYYKNLELTKNMGHYYQNYFSDITTLSEYYATKADSLYNQTCKFMDNMYSSDIDQTVLDQVNSHFNTLITSTTLNKKGQFAIREGLTPSQAWGPNSTIDVALYGSPMLIALFPELQKSMMRTHKKLQSENGEINHGLGFDPDFNQNGTWGVYERVDLVPDYIQMVLRDYLWTNDKTYITEMWPSVKKGIDYILKYRDKDGDQMPDMNGIMCSYDNFPMYGLAAYVQSQWIVAMHMAGLVAKDLGEPYLAAKYNKIALKGSALMDEKLWNGTYYNLSNDYLGKKGIDDGCLTDQLIGQWVAFNSGLGYLFKPEHVRQSLETILAKSFIDRSFLRNCTWPKYPEIYPFHTTDLWVDQANTPWSGVELAFASLLIYDGMPNEGLQVVKGVDKRYRDAGLYYDHQEFGGHYFRAMSAWSILNAYLGFSVHQNTLQFSPKLQKDNYSLQFVTPDSYGLYIKTGNSIQIKITSGTQKLKKIEIQHIDLGYKNLKLYYNSKPIKNYKITHDNDSYMISFKNEFSINSTEILELK